MEKQNAVINSHCTLSIEKSTERAQKYLREAEDFKNGYIYVDSPTLCDLFIVENRKLRPCTTKEWSFYFKTMLYPPAVVAPEPVRRGKQVTSL